MRPACGRKDTGFSWNGCDQKGLDQQIFGSENEQTERVKEPQGLKSDENCDQPWKPGGNTHDTTQGWPDSKLEGKIQQYNEEPMTTARHDTLDMPGDLGRDHLGSSGLQPVDDTARAGEHPHAVTSRAGFENTEEAKTCEVRKMSSSSGKDETPLSQVVCCNVDCVVQARSSNVSGSSVSFNASCIQDGLSSSAPTLGVPAWRASARVVEPHSAAAAHGGVGRRRMSDRDKGSAQSTPSDRSGNQQDGSKEELPGGICEDPLGSVGDRQRDDRPAEDQGHGGSIPPVSRTCNGPHGLRHVCRKDLCRGDAPAPGLCPMGSEDMPRGRNLPQACPLRPMGSDQRSHRGSEDYSHEGLQEQSQLQGSKEFHRESARGPDLGVDQGSSDSGEGGEGDERREGDTTQGEHRGRDFFERMGDHAGLSLDSPEGQELPKGSFYEIPPAATVGTLKPAEARHIEFLGERATPEAFQALVTFGRPLLFELACGPESVLTKSMHQLTGDESSAQRLSFWNGFDFSTSLGVRSAIKKIDKEKPLAVWMSFECGPFSKMQNVNQRNEKQIEELKLKRANCMRQYVGGLLIYMHCYQQGIPCTWEWSETNDAWRLPMVQRVFEKYPPEFVVTKGCRVKLLDNKNQRLLQKGWKLATTHPHIARTMNLPCTCPGNMVHAKCEGALTRKSAYYTAEFARRVCKAIVDEISNLGLWSELRGLQEDRVLETKTASCSCAQVKHPKSELNCNICELEAEKSHSLALAGEDVEMGPLTVEETQRALKHIAMIHRNSGHGPMTHLIKSLELRKTDPRIVQLAREFECDVCKEAVRVVPRPRVSLEPLPPKWKVLQADNATWHHPTTGEKCQFTICIDEGCRFRLGKIICKGSGSGIKARDFVQFFTENWKPVFGKPDRIRLDPAGPWRSQEISKFFDEQNIELDIIPAEAHWGVSHVERAIEATKHIMTKLAMELPDTSPEELLSEAIRVENEREVVRGYSPAQHALGRSPDSEGHFHQSALQEVPHVLCESGSGEFQRNVERMRISEQSFSEWIANERIKRAENTRSYRLQCFAPGDLVFVWRQQNPNSRHGAQAHRGGFTGPARVLATETRQNEDGSFRPGSVVWLVRGSRLIKAAPQQLRKASLREECQEEIQNPPSLPWTFTQLMDEVGSRQYDDVTDEIPDDMEFEQGIDEETQGPPPKRLRVRGKQWVPSCPPPNQPSSSRGVAGVTESDEVIQKPREIEFGLYGSENDKHEGECFWSQEDAAVEICFETPETKRGLKYMAESFESFLVSNLRRRAVEVNERHLSPDERIQMDKAKYEEVKKFISAEALEGLPAHLQPNPETAMKMRWVLTWKKEETGDKKAKARCVILGYMDPNYEHRQVASPTMTRSTRQLLLSIAAALGFSVSKGDVSGAFLQGREYKGEAYVIPTKEICEIMKIPEGSVTKLKKACYGLVDAPLEWFLTVSDFLVSLGFERCVSDPCCFKYVENGVLIGLISGHVDDFLFCGLETCDKWKQLCEEIQKRFKWGLWEKDKFVQCGVEITRTSDGGFALSQTQYIDDLKEINISSERRREIKSPTTQLEKSKLRAALGALSWCAQQTCPHLSAGVSLLLSQVNCSTVETMLETNKLVYRTKCQRKHQLLIHGGLSLQDTIVAGWADASVQNRVDGKSTRGIFIGLTSKKLLMGQMCKVSAVAWNSTKIVRQCRSPGAAECLAAIDCEDLLYAIRLQFFEMCGNKVQVRKTESQVAQVPGVLVTDSTNVHDRLHTHVYVPKGPEHRVALEMIGLKEALTNTNLPIRWVNSDAQLANSLTKDTELHQIQRFYHLGQCWKIVEDPLMMSAKNRKKQGLDPLDENEESNRNSQQQQTRENEVLKTQKFVSAPGDVSWQIASKPVAAHCRFGNKSFWTKRS